MLIINQTNNKYMENLVKVNPKEFGLKETEVITIEQAFLPKIQEREALSVIYKELITKELTPELCKRSKEIRLKLVKVRTGIAEIHKSQKSYFLAAGKFVDAWKNKETLPVEQMEEKLYEIETYYERMERERSEKLESERLEKVKVYTDFPAANLYLMSDETFDAYLTGCKVAYEAKIEAERKAEKERLEQIEAEKEAARLKLIEDERIRKENEELRIEKERLEKERIEREKQIQIEKEKEAKKQADMLAKEKAEAEEKIAKQKRLSDIEAKKQAEIIAEQQRKLKEKEEAELKEKQRIESERIAKEKAEKEALKAPDRDKLIKWVDAMKIDKPALNEAEMIAISNMIEEKFNSFKSWALLQIKNI